MKHNYRTDPNSDNAQLFLSWLETETVKTLRSDYGNLDAVKSSTFLYVNRAYEAGLPDDIVGHIFGKCISKAGYSEAEQDIVFDLLETLATTAKGVHSVG
ncbi:MAG: hypothetical protein AB8B96_05080 [Lysobacterales bacterium]